LKYGFPVNKNIYRSKTFGFKFSCSVFITGFIYIISLTTLANSIGVNHSQLEQYITLVDEDVLLNPAGEGVFISVDLNDQWSAHFDYQTWQDKEQATIPVTIDLELATIGGSLSYVQDNWYASTSIGFSEDDISHSLIQNRFEHRHDNTQVTSFSGVLGTNWLNGNWMLDLSMGIQYADWSIENTIYNSERAQQDGKPPKELSITKSNSSIINASMSAARYWELTQAQGILAGVMLSWNYQFAGDENLTANIPPPTRTTTAQPTTSRNISVTPSRVTSGDDNYGQITSYLSYDLNKNWSIDVDTSIEIATINNNLSWAIGINYSF